MTLRSSQNTHAHHDRSSPFPAEPGSRPEPLTYQIVLEHEVREFLRCGWLAGGFTRFPIAADEETAWAGLFPLWLAAILTGRDADR